MEIRVFVTPEVIGAELADWAQVDWSSVWNGPPNDPDEGGWSSRYGWKPVELQRQLEVETRHGSVFEFHSDGMWAPVNAVTRGLLRIGSQDPGERDPVLDEVTQRWEAYLAHAVAAVGEPTGVGVAGRPGFPVPPANEWSVPDSERENPRRLAYWEGFGGGPDAPVLIMDQGVTRPTWDEPARPSSDIDLLFKRPHGWRRP